MTVPKIFLGIVVSVLSGYGAYWLLNLSLFIAESAGSKGSSTELNWLAMRVYLLIGGSVTLLIISMVSGWRTINLLRGARR